MKSAKSNRSVWLIAMAFFPAVVMAQTSFPANIDSLTTRRYEFSLHQAVDYANKNNVQVKNALLDVKLQQQVNREVTANAYPHINANVNTSYNPNVATQVIPNFISPATYQVLIDEGVKGNNGPIQMPSDFGFIAAQFGTKYSATAGISLSQILFDGQVFVGLQARSTTLDWKRKNLEVTEEMIKTNIHKVYYQLVVSKTQIELLDANIERLKKLQHNTKVMYENGFAEKLDIDKITVQLTNLESEKVKVLNTVSNGYYGLKVLLGMPVMDELILTDTLSYDQIRDGLLEVSGYKYEDRKEYQFAELGKKLNEYNIKRYKLSQIPTLSLNGNYAKNAQRDKFNFTNKGPWYSISSVSLNLSIPIFNGFATRSKIQQAQIELQKTENQIDALKLSIDSEVASAKNNFRSAISTLDFQKDNMALAERVYEQTQKKYEAGTGSQIEITNAQTDLKAAQTNYINALYDAIIAKTDFLKATGKL
ncbi:TolC family protein [Terrimonas pollutisoli]|uniref:TolC family protein n=1 Tax=Terrimonas pollutisoli TaxID=3034147 RepID=UPI0023EC23DC|nr:TolC family protein [Terrimonas sp. H1YJ31]